MRLDSFARHPLTFGPSPVHPLDRLTQHLGGARLWAKRDDCNSGLAYKESWEQALADVERGGGKPYAIPAGASDHELGGLGFARWAQEVAEQERELGVFFDTIVVCSVTGSTHAGMVAGFAAQDRERRVIGIDGSAKPAETRAQVARNARATAALIEVGRELRGGEIERDSNVLYAHLGGQPALSAYAGLFR